MNRRSVSLALCLGAVAGAPALPLPAAAQGTPSGKSGAAVTLWAEGLQGPQGVVRNSRGEVLVVEHDAGRVSRFSADGRRLGVLAQGLQSPAWGLMVGDTLYVSERKGNSVARISPTGAVSRLPGEIIDPLGLAAGPAHPDSLLVLSHRQSQVRSFSLGPGAPSLRPEPVLAPESGAKYGWRDVALAPDGTLYVTDETSRAVLRRAPNEPLRPWASGLSSPSGLAFSPSGALYVTEEGTGRLSRLEADGKPTVFAEGMGMARAALFLDARTVLVTDRNGGKVWKVVLPQ